MIFHEFSAQMILLESLCDGQTDGRIDGRMEGPTDRRTIPLIGKRGRIQKYQPVTKDLKRWRGKCNRQNWRRYLKAHLHIAVKNISQSFQSNLFTTINR